MQKSVRLTSMYNSASFHSYCFRATLADTTGSIVVACYSPAAHSLVPSITELLSYVPDRDPYTAPPIIKDLENTTHRFHVHLGKASRRGYPNFILDNASSISAPASPETHGQHEGQSSSTPTTKLIIEQEAIQITPGSASPPPSASTPAHTILRIKAAEPESDTDITETAASPVISESVGTGTAPADPTAADQPLSTKGPTETPDETDHPKARRQLFAQPDEQHAAEKLKKARHE